MGVCVCKHVHIYACMCVYVRVCILIEIRKKQKSLRKEWEAHVRLWLFVFLALAVCNSPLKKEPVFSVFTHADLFFPFAAFFIYTTKLDLFLEESTRQWLQNRKH